MLEVTINNWTEEVPARDGAYKVEDDNLNEYWVIVCGEGVSVVPVDNCKTQEVQEGLVEFIF